MNHRKTTIKYLVKYEKYNYGEIFYDISSLILMQNVEFFISVITQEIKAEWVAL